MNPISPSPLNGEERKMLQEVIEISRENNAILHKMMRAQHWASFWRLMYWVVIIGSVVVGYYSLQPYLEPMIQSYGKVVNLLK